MASGAGFLWAEGWWGPWGSDLGQHLVWPARRVSHPGTRPDGVRRWICMLMGPALRVRLGGVTFRSLATGPTAPFADFPKVQGTGGTAGDGLVVGFAGGWACVAPSLLWLSCPLPRATFQNTGSAPGRAQAWVLAAPSRPCAQ